MSNSQYAPTHGEDGHEFHGENDNVIAPGAEVPQANLEGAPIANPVDVSLHVALNTDLGADPEGSIHRESRSGGQGTQVRGDGGVSLQVIFEMLQAQHAAIAQLQNQHRFPSGVELEITRRTGPVQDRLKFGDRSCNNENARGAHQNN